MSDEIDEILEKEKNSKGQNKEIYEKIKSYLSDLKEGSIIKIDTGKTNELIDDLKKSCPDTSLKNKIELKSPIYKETLFFNIDRQINILGIR